MKAFLVITLFSSLTHAMSVDWSGSYRFEYVTVDMPNLSPNATGGKGTKSYFLNHLNLSPKIIALDGVHIVANFEVLPANKYPGSQLGTDFGNWDTSSNGTSYTAGVNQGVANLEVNQLYMNWNHEYGSMVAGRAPVHFGMGISHNASNGPFDHWMQTRDMFGYKFLIGNLAITPSLGRTARNNSYALAGGATEQIWQIDYTNPESESTFAVFHQIKSSGTSSNDGNVYLAPYHTTPVVASGWNTSHTNLYIARGWEKFKFKLEAGFQSGSTGITSATSGGRDIKLSGYGIAMEIEVPRPQSKFQWNVKMGVASGDDPSTTDQFEGFHFSRNYDVSMLLFNHPMGAGDTMRSRLARHRSGTSGATIYGNDSAADEEVITNAFFIAPQFRYIFNDKWSWDNSIVYASSQVAAGTGVATDLGFEWDTGITYRPHKRLTWKMDIGMFAPGTAWKMGGSNFDINFVYGIETKAAISF